MANCVALFLVVVILTCAAAHCAASHDDDSPVIDTKFGLVQGFLVSTAEQKCRAYLGIPFAKAPLGPLRFSAPIKPDPWTGRLLKAKRYGNICVSVPSNLTIPNESEDCLYLHVVAPVEQEKPLPVMVWIHGGGFIAARSQFEVEAACENFVNRGVVLVAIQYRVGYLGFIASGDAVAKGNYGLLDQIAALKWIHESIGKFGGDASSVTVFGSSAGGASASMLGYSPLGREYLHRTISQSGSPFAYWAFNYRSKKSFPRFAKAAGCSRLADSEAVLNCLRDKSLDALQKAHLDEFGPESYAKRKRKGEHYTGGGHGLMEVQSFSWSPTFDGVVFPKSFADLAKSSRPLPAITGISNRESFSFAKPWIYWPTIWNKIVRPNLPNVIPFWIDHGKENIFQRSTLEKEIRRAVSVFLDTMDYHPDEEERTSQQIHIDRLTTLANSIYLGFKPTQEQLIFSLYQLAGDVWMNYPAVQDAINRKNNGGQVWLYVLGQPLSLPAKNLSSTFKGSVHSDVGNLVFVRSNKMDKNAVSQDEEMLAVRDLILDMWTNFAKNGTPSSPNTVDWPQFESAEKTTHLRIELPKSKVSDSFLEPYTKIWMTAAKKENIQYTTDELKEKLVIVKDEL